MFLDCYKKVRCFWKKDVEILWVGRVFETFGCIFGVFCWLKIEVFYIFMGYCSNYFFWFLLYF